MKDIYRYAIHAYEDARQKRPMKHERVGRPPSSQTALRCSDEPKCSPKSSRWARWAGLHPPRVQRRERVDSDRGL
jgi:hypothetical protein